MFGRFLRYVHKIFDFGQAVDMVDDSRVEPRIPTAAIWTSAFVMMATRRGSLNGIDQEMRLPKRLDGIIGPAKPSADSIGRVFAQMASAPLREILSAIHHRLKRNKALPSPWPVRAVAVDGHEFFSQSTPSLPGV